MIMKKYNIYILVVVFILIISWVFYYSVNNKKLDTKLDTKNDNDKLLKEYITSNYSSETHQLDLRSKKLQLIPELCDITKWTKYIYDIWSIDLADNWLNLINSDFSCFKNLSELDLSFNKIESITNLSNLEFLQKLDLGNNLIKEIFWLDKLIKLSDLHLGYNQITKVNWLDKLKNLSSLKLQHNQIDDISWLSNLSNLSELKLEFNKLDDNDLLSLKNLKNLKILTLKFNNIKDETVDKYNKMSLDNMKQN